MGSPEGWIKKNRYLLLVIIEMKVPATCGHGAKRIAPSY
jgi:hypothetical protein